MGLEEKFDLSTLPEAYKVILSQATDISDMSIVTEKPDPSFALVPRIHGWKPIPVARMISSAEKRRRADCALCGADERTHSLVWHAYGVDKNVEKALEVAQDAGLTEVSVKLIRSHFPNHNYDQPAPAKRIAAEELVKLVEDLPDRHKNIIRAVYRQRVLSTKQIIALFYEPTTTNDKSAAKSAYRELHNLRFNHLLYPFRTEKRKAAEVFYALGKHSVPWLEMEEGKLAGDQICITRRDQIKEYQLEHDMLAADVVVQLTRQLYTTRDKNNLIPVQGQPMSLSIPTDCWWGERSLRMRFKDLIRGEERMVAPDGFAALRMNDGRHRQFMLPFFVEWDSGHKKLEDTAEQLASYVDLARSGAIGKRFPQLAVPGYAPPVLLVASTPTRAARISGRAKELIEEKRLNGDFLPLLLVSDLETMRNSGFAPGAWRNVMAETAESVNLAEQLLLGNQVLTEKAPIHWRVPIGIDPDGARAEGPKNAKSTRKTVTVNSRELLASLAHTARDMTAHGPMESLVGDLIAEAEKDTVAPQRLDAIIQQLQDICSGAEM